MSKEKSIVSLVMEIVFLYLSLEAIIWILERRDRVYASLARTVSAVKRAREANRVLYRELVEWLGSSTGRFEAWSAERDRENGNPKADGE